MLRRLTSSSSSPIAAPVPAPAPAGPALRLRSRSSVASSSGTVREKTAPRSGCEAYQSTERGVDWWVAAGGATWWGQGFQGGEQSAERRKSEDLRMQHGRLCTAAQPPSSRS